MARMHQTTLMFPPLMWQQIKGLADDDGISAASWVREACLARIMFRRGWEHDEDFNRFYERAEDAERQSAPPAEGRR